MIEFPILIVDSNKEIRLISSQICQHLNDQIEFNLEKLESMMQAAEAGWLTDNDFPGSAFYKIQANNVILMSPFLIPELGGYRVEGVDRLFSRDIIEISCATLIEVRDQFFDEFSEDINMLVHDLRRMSAEIYHQAIDAKSSLDKRHYIASIMAMDEIINLHELLKIRTDILDVVGNSSSIIKQIEFISIKDTVKKICGIMESRAKSDGKHIKFNELSGYLVQGPAAFEIICYTLIDNAIKYSHHGGEIRCSVIDLKSRQAVSFTTESYGPVIEDDEFHNIFSRKFRGANAQRSGKPGTGYGLYILKNLVENDFNGIVAVSQNKDDFINNAREGKLLRTRFEVIIPAISESFDNYINIPPIKLLD